MPGLDKFYTLEETAKICIDYLYSLYSEIDFNKELFLEPSAGSGSFSKQLPHCLALDIAPEGENILQRNFLTFDPSEKYKHFITIGNPPFGHRSKLAVEFFNQAAKFSDLIAFIVPVSFMKYGVQKQLLMNWSLVNCMKLPEQSFTENGKPYSVRTVYQIWAKQGSKFDKKINHRILKQPPIIHPDFRIWQHNATEQSRSTVDEPWEFATWRQGYKNFNEIFTRDSYDWLKQQVLTTNQQFFFIQPLTDHARNVIQHMDFNELAERNTSTPGFGKGDFVSYYMEIEGNYE